VVTTAYEPIQTASPFVTETLAPHETTESVPSGKLLFREGDEPRGVYFLHSGEVDLVFSSRTGDAKALRVAEPGQLLGLSCVVSHRPHDCSATTKEPAIVGFIEKDEFQKLLEEKPALWLTVLQMISTDINACWDCMRTLSGVAAR
jgi:CRP-like cAMP-binding protein